MTNYNPHDPNNYNPNIPPYPYGPPTPQVSQTPTFSQPAPQPNGSAFVKNKKKTTLIPTVAAFSLVSALLGGAVGGVAVATVTADNGTQISTTQTADQVTTTTNLTNTSDLTTVINNKLPSIVTISVIDGEQGGTGSGVVLNTDGYIATNAHVATLAGATITGSITVQTSTGDIYDAKLVGYDPNADLAVLQIDKTAKGIRPIQFADSDKAEIGTETIAIGSPLGLTGTVTTGVVSALNRPITVASSDVQQTQRTQQTQPGTVALNAIQTDAAINPGNSGGALLDANGNLIGINVAIASSGENSGNIGVGFAIPSNYVKRITTEIIQNGKATHGYLGTGIADYTAEGTAFTSGALIKTVEPGSAAAKAELKTGDIITEINGTPVESGIQLTAIVKQNAPGSEIKITYTRGSEEKTTTVTLDSAK
jgi:putative serine protease PepD